MKNIHSNIHYCISIIANIHYCISKIVWQHQQNYRSIKAERDLFHIFEKKFFNIFKSIDSKMKEHILKQLYEPYEK